MAFSTTEINLDVFLYALTLQSEPLPEPLQQSFQQVGQALQNNHPEAARRLREEIRLHPPLEDAYAKALEEWDQQYTSQQCTKNTNIVFADYSNTYEVFVSQVLPAHDWVEAVKRLTDTNRTESKNIFLDAITDLKQRLVGQKTNNLAAQQVETRPIMTYGKFSGPNQSSEDDFKLAEFNSDIGEGLHWS